MFRFVIYITLALFLFSCQKEIEDSSISPVKTPVDIRFVPTAGTETLMFDSVYRNQYDEPFRLSAFKFYIHDIRLVNTGSGIYSRIDKDVYHLIDLKNPDLIVEGSVSTGSYDAIEFVLGVDSLYNVSGAQSGDLDPLKGMFWTWNSGYIMAKLEGNTPVANTPNNAFQYHIGGFAGDNNVVKRIRIVFPGSTIDVGEFKNLSVQLQCDVMTWFAGQHEIRLATNPVCMTPGSLAKQIAANYYSMFSVGEIKDIQ